MKNEQKRYQRPTDEGRLREYAFAANKLGISIVYESIDENKSFEVGPEGISIRTVKQTQTQHPTGEVKELGEVIFPND